MLTTFCNQEENCGDLPEVQTLILRFEDFLGSSCATLDSTEEDRIILALRGLKSFGLLKRSATTVEKCFTDNTNSMFIRLAALDTVRSLNCRSDDYDFKKALWNMFADTTGDSELRIGAYLALMSCPTSVMVNLVKNVLVTEPVNQGNKCLS